jgi:hypothetical protein
MPSALDMVNGEAASAASRSPHVIAAGSYIACGLAVFPVERGGKKPLVAWKELIGHRLIDEHTFEELDRYIFKWWDKPEPPNIGVPTGVEVFLNEHSTAPLIVVDVDDEAARERVQATCAVATPTVRTPRGGLHLWFTYREVGNRARVAGVGLDVRGLGGFVVAPPSVGANGQPYEWIVSPRDVWPPAPMPQALAELIWPKRTAVRPAMVPKLPPKRRNGYARAALEREAAAVRTAPEGTRNDTLNRAAYALARFIRSGELSAAEIAAELVSSAVAAGLGEAEARRTVASGLKGRT